MALFGRESEEDRLRADAWGEWARQRNPFALASVVLGAFSLIELGAIPIFSVGGLILGIVALRQLAGPAPAQPLGHRLAWTGIVLCAIALTLGILIYTRSIFMP